MSPKAVPHIPAKLPPEIDLSDIVKEIGDARHQVGRLQGALLRSRVSRELLTTPLVTKEAVQSSAIEGTVASMQDVFQFEADEASVKSEELRRDAQEILNYRRALEAAIEEIAQRAIGENLLKKTHLILMSSVRGENKRRGEFRKSQIWVGKRNAPIEEAEYIPPPPDQLTELLGNWEQYINSQSEPDPLVQIAVAHYQFEAIHPFLDGNGRIGRLLIPLFLVDRGLLPAPVIYVSDYFEKNRSEYLQALRDVDSGKKWNEWLRFFLTAIQIKAMETTITLSDVELLYLKYRGTVDTFHSPFGRPMLDALFRLPIVDYRYLVNRLGASNVTVYNLLEKFEEAGILYEITGKQRNRQYALVELIDLMRP